MGSSTSFCSSSPWNGLGPAADASYSFFLPPTLALVGLFFKDLVLPCFDAKKVGFKTVLDIGRSRGRPALRTDGWGVVLVVMGLDLPTKELNLVAEGNFECVAESFEGGCFSPGSEVVDLV